MKMQGNVSTSMDVEFRHFRDLRTEKVYGKQNTTLLKDTGNENHALFNVLPAFDYILSHLETAKKRTDLSPHITMSINLAWIKMNDYYQKSDDSKVYLVAAVLDPRVKLAYFKENRKKEWCRGLREKLDAYMREFTTAKESIDNQSSPPPSQSSSCNLFGPQSGDESWGCWYPKAHDIVRPAGGSEWDQYLAESRVIHTPTFSYRRWWIDDQARFPILLRMALELLAVPAMSTEVERVFSGYVKILCNFN